MTELPESSLTGAGKRLALVTLLAGILVALLGFFAPPASAAQLLRPETRVAAIAEPAGQLVGPSYSVLAGESRQRAPNYDQNATGSSVAAEGGVTSGVPESAESVLNTIDSTGSAPSGYQGGRPFLNDGRGGGEVLPSTDAQGSPITYREWDVNPYQQGVNRGAERLVTGSNGSAYYTNNHYQTFIQIRP